MYRRLGGRVQLGSCFVCTCARGLAVEWNVTMCRLKHNGSPFPLLSGSLSLVPCESIVCSSELMHVQVNAGACKWVQVRPGEFKFARVSASEFK